MKAIINAKIYDYVNYIENGYIIFDRQIIEVGEMKNFSGHYETVDAKGKLVLPGLVNGHTHIYSTLFRGAPMQVAPHDFKAVLDEIWWPFDKALNIDAVELSAHMYAKESLKAGVTSLIDHHASGEIADSLMTIHHTLEKIGLKHLLCFETSDRFDFELCLVENQFAMQHRGYFGLHASLSLSDETLKLVKASLNESPIHIHVAESIIDEEDSKKKYGLSVVKRLNKFGLLNRNSILAHCVYIDDEEAAMINENGCRIAINPASNLNNAVGLYKAGLIKKYDIPVLVGTDGLGVNVARSWQDLYYVGKQSMKDPSGIEFSWLIKQMVTGYEYFSEMSGQLIGLLRKDYDSDFMIVDYDFITPINENNIFAHVLFGVFDGLKPYSVYTNGTQKIDQYQFVDEFVLDRTIVDELWGKLS